MLIAIGLRSYLLKLRKIAPVGKSVGVKVLPAGRDTRVILPLPRSTRRGRGKSVQPLQIWVEDWELGVVLLEDPDGGPLDGKVTDGEGPGLAVRGADHLDVEPGKWKRGEKLVRCGVRFCLNLLKYCRDEVFRYSI